ncbi:unnamed protein product [Menidia menidia]|uniref:(Atlantic silverside) hypothetical protein n=1 Tax=Menidia menidia TaxID=238744 RepID=A0A8S4BZM7_9TELE|nr:unnamed protein product [Menidia menidia]
MFNFWLPSTFYGKRRETAVVPVHPNISDDVDEDEDDDVSDPDFVPPTHNQDIPGPSDMGPSTKRKRLQPAVEVLQDSGSDIYSVDNDDDDNEQPAPQAKRPSKPSKSAARPTTWHKVDLNNTALPEYQHSTPDYIDVPFQYFTRYFDNQIIRHITYQTNLYAAQDINTTFTTNKNEILAFVTILIYMGIVELPSVDDYWAIETRVPQVAKLMSSKRASEDGFIHDIVLYQGKTTMEAHDVPLKPEQEGLGATSQIVSVLASTMSFPDTTAIYADNFFTSLELVRYLRDHNCSEDGILAVKWKDNKTVTLLSTDMGVGPMSTVIRYCSESKKREPVSCPAVIRSYNANMGGIDKSDMLVHLYRTPMKSKR